MNNTTRRTLAIVVLMLTAATLVVGAAGTFTTTGQSAYAYTKKDNGKGNGNGNTVTIEKCKQLASESGFDNNQAQECENVICTHPGENATCVQEGAVSTAAAVTPPPVKKTCEQCWTTFLTPQQIAIVLGSASLAQFCAALEGGTITEDDFRDSLSGAGVSGTTADEFIACLLQAGVVFKV
jgi:hypothetical protein